MKQFLILIVLFLIFGELISGQTTCSGTQQCLHSGRWNSNLCRCDCFSTYSGSWCEKSNCTAQPSICGTGLFPDQCLTTTVQDYCPKMCTRRGCECPNGIDQCLNGGLYNSNDCSCACPSGFTGNVCQTISSCITLQCLNSGSFNTEKCKCECFTSYSGSSFLLP